MAVSWEVVVYEVGGQRGLILIPEGRKGWGWCPFAAELGKVTKYFDASVESGDGYSSPAENSSRPVRKLILKPFPSLGNEVELGSLSGLGAGCVAPNIPNPSTALPEVEQVPAINGTPLLGSEDASGPLLQPVVVPVDLPSQEVASFSATASHLVRQHGLPLVSSKDAGDPFLILPSV